MTAPSLNERFFATTRGQIILLLRPASRTVEELAQLLRLTDNGVRAHLATLERDGLVEQRGVVRRGLGKPAFLYALTAEAERLFPKAYEPVLRQLLDVLEERERPEQVESLLRATGRHLARTLASPEGDLRARVGAASETLNELGGLTDVEETEREFWIQGQACPLAALVPDHPQMCWLAEALLSELVGQPVQEHCARDGAPRCRFAIEKTV
ncbi:MAG TPA: helix-turn-helix domain-containing protein [Ktedonobacterales bacterium]|nr:helix-turn-helix domain-containing protein [Ktedonobacterales bacterium]